MPSQTLLKHYNLEIASQPKNRHTETITFLKLVTTLTKCTSKLTGMTKFKGQHSHRNWAKTEDLNDKNFMKIRILERLKIYKYLNIELGTSNDNINSKWK